MIASRVAAKLRQLTDITVEIVNGGLGELRVAIDDQDVYTAGRLWYPRVGTVVKIVQSRLNKTAN